MSFQWTCVAAFLFVEIAFIVLMMLPWIRPPFWAKIFKSRFVKAIEAYSYIYIYGLGTLLSVLFLDAIREVRKYSAIDPVDPQHNTAQAEAFLHMRLFRAQRNLYISGFAVFLWFLIRRMMQLMMNEAHLIASAEAALKQAHSASSAAEKLLDDKASKKGGATEAESELAKTIKELREKLSTAEKDRDAMRDQAEGIKREYDRFLKETDKRLSDDKNKDD